MTVNCVTNDGDILKFFNIAFPVQCNFEEKIVTFKNFDGKCYNISLTVIVYFEVFNETPSYIQSLRNKNKLESRG